MLDEAGVPAAYTAVGSYPDRDLLRLLDVTPPEAGTTSQDRLHWFGRHAMPALVGR